ncbi:prepilin peptidase [Patescibacteria group bacterium]
MLSFELLLFLVAGFIFGSFITSLSWRLVSGVSLFGESRSICPKCKKEIAWYDNIPLLSYLLLHGKCRKCKKKVSVRYPLIELFTAFLFALVWYYYRTDIPMGELMVNGSFYWWMDKLGNLTIPFFFSIIVILVSIFVTDFENQIIPDVLVFIGFALVALVLFIIHPQGFYTFFLSGFLSALFLLGLHAITRGKGMGLGDVKLALFGGILLGWPLTAIWLFLSFVVGAVVGLMLIIIGKARFKQKIAFGPFMVIALLITLFWGTEIIRWIGIF